MVVRPRNDMVERLIGGTTINELVTSKTIGLICLVDVFGVILWTNQQINCVDFQNALRHDIIYLSDNHIHLLET